MILSTSPASSPVQQTYPNGSSANPPVYVARLVERLDQAGSAPVLRHQDADIPAATLLASIFRYARALSSIGIGRSTLVALLAPNHPDALAIRYAANLIGAATTYLSVPPSEAARSDLIRQVAPDLLVVYPETMGLVPADADAKVATVGDTGIAAAIHLDELAARQMAEPMSCQARPDDLGIVVSSGGSTGIPKGSWRTFSAYTAIVTVPSSADRRQLVNGRLAYLSQVLVDVTLLGGGLVVLYDSFDPVETLEAIERERITDLFLVEPQLFELMDHPDMVRRDLSSLCTLTHIGASAPPTLRRRACDRLGPVIAHTYGASEMGLVSVLTPSEHDPSDPACFTSAGRIHPGVEVRFRDAEGRLAAPDIGGSIEVRSPAMAGGYLHRPDLQAPAFRDGWYLSGDLGRLDGSGRLHILGRSADILSLDGVQVSPTMIEDTLCRVSCIRYAVAVTELDTRTWIAAVEPWLGSVFDERACRQGIAAEHSSQVADRVRIVPVRKVPRTEQGKPNRVAIQKLLGRS